jgi:hypothetical protein
VDEAKEEAIDEVIGSPAEAVGDVGAGSVIGIGGFGAGFLAWRTSFRRRGAQPCAAR